MQHPVCEMGGHTPVERNVMAGLIALIVIVFAAIAAAKFWHLAAL